MSGILLLEFVQAVLEVGADDVAVADEVVLFDEVDDGGRGDAGDGISAEGGDGGALVGVGDFGRGDGEADGEAVAEDFGGGEDVGLDLPVLDAEPAFAGATPAGLDFVGDEVSAVLLDDGEGDLEVLFGRRDEAADALDGFGDHAGDAAGGGGLDDGFDVLGAGDFAGGVGFAERAAIAVGVHRVDDADLVGGLAPGGDAGERAGDVERPL